MSLPRLCLLVRLNFVAPLPFTVTKPDFNLLICTLQRLDTVLQSVHRKPLVDDQLLDRADVRPGTVVWGGGGGRWGGRLEILCLLHVTKLCLDFVVFCSGLEFTGNSLTGFIVSTISLLTRLA